MNKMIDHFFQPMLTSLSNDLKAMSNHDWSALSIDEFSALFYSKDSINKSFQKYELIVCCRSVNTIFLERGLEWHHKLPNYKMVELFVRLTNGYQFPEYAEYSPIEFKNEESQRSQGMGDGHG